MFAIKITFIFGCLFVIAGTCKGEERLPCIRDGECDFPNAHCFFEYKGCQTGYCECNDGYFLSEGSLFCQKVRHLGEYCDSDDQCDASVGYMKCLDGECRCPDGETLTHRSGEKSYCEDRRQGQSCTTNDECLNYRINPETGFCNTDAEEPLCACISTHTRLVEHECVLATYNNWCTSLECGDSLVCMEDDEDVLRCLCQENTTWNGEYELCLHNDAKLDLEVGEDCLEEYHNEDGRFCSLDLVCNRCMLSDSEFVCMDPRLDMCSDDFDCNLTNSKCDKPYYSCDYGTCSCNPGFYRKSSTSCRKASELGGDCELDDDCEASVAHSFCHEGICTCAGGEDVYTLNGRAYCYLKSAGQHCARDRDCLAQRINPEMAQCYGSAMGLICLCNPSYQIYGQVCEKVRIHEYCGGNPNEFGDQVCVSNSECTDYYCRCGDYQYWDYFSNQCAFHPEKRNLRPGDNCDGLNLCSPWLECSKCPWEPEEIPVCQVKNTEINDVCTRNLDCNIENSHCVFPYEGCRTGNCKCLDGFYLSSDLICKPERRIGEMCDTSEDCISLSPFAVCGLDYTCQCLEGEESIYEYDGKAYCYSYRNGESVGNITNWSGCLSYKLTPLGGGIVGPDSNGEYQCGCWGKFVEDGERCVPVPYGDECDMSNGEDRLCAESTTCLDQDDGRACLCVNGTTWVPEYNLCIHDEAITNLPKNESCHTEYFSDNGRFCHPTLTCDSCPGSDDTRCQTLAGGIGNQCRYNDDCLADNSECIFPFDNCRFGVCQCKNGFYEPATSSMICKPVSPFGGECDNQEDCWSSVVHSNCIDNVCQCAENEEVYVHDGKSYCYKSKASEFCYFYMDCLTYRIDEYKGDCIQDTSACGCRKQFVLDGEICVTVPYGDVCIRDGEEKQCDPSLECNNISETCLCPDNTFWDDDYSLCIHDEAETHLPENSECNEVFDDDSGLLCQPYLICDTCSQQDSEPSCQWPRGYNTTDPPVLTTDSYGETTSPHDYETEDYVTHRDLTTW